MMSNIPEHMGGGIGASAYDSNRIYIPSEEDINRIHNTNKKNILLKKIKSINFDNLSIEQLEEIANITSKIPPEIIKNQNS